MEIKCDNCGKIFEYKQGIAHFNRSNHHYCSRNCQVIGNNKIKGNTISGLAKRDLYGKQNKKYSIWCQSKKRAKKRHIEFNLSIFDIPEIPVRCPILGIEIIANKIGGPIDSSPSLDRINNNKGYIPGNVRIISNRANRLRQDGTIKEWELLIKDAKKIQNQNK